MKLSELIKACTPLEVVGNTEIDITDIELDSRRVGHGTMFVAMRGTQSDGHQYIDKALELGANAIVCESLPEEKKPGVTYIRYENTTDVVGLLATQYYGNPTLRMKLIGVTGTNGKTTIATTLYNIVRRMGIKAGLCSTVCNYIDGKAYPTECTTPDPITLNRLLGKMRPRRARPGTTENAEPEASADEAEN